MLDYDHRHSPDPFKPAALDAYGTSAAPHECVVAWVDDLRLNDPDVGFFWKGIYQVMAVWRFSIFVRSAGLHPRGRLTRPTGAPEPQASTEPQTEPQTEPEKLSIEVQDLRRRLADIEPTVAYLEELRTR